MKLAIIFEVPDDRGGAYADVAARLIQRHAFAEQQAIKHWSFDQEMRPVAAALVPAIGQMASTVREARREIDQDHPWIPGRVFRMHEGLKPLMLWIMDLLT